MPRSDDVRRRTFFYADEDADVFDATADLTQPQLQLIHELMLDLVERTLPPQALKRLVILDVGSGTGAQSLDALSRFPGSHVVAVDFSPRMNDILRSKFSTLFPTARIEDRLTIVETDFFSDELTVNELLARIPVGFGDAYSAATTGFMLHHYTGELKLRAYQKIYDTLSPLGILVHGDLFSYESPEMTRLSHEIGEQWIVEQLSARPRAEYVERVKALGDRVVRLLERWIEHWNHHHILHPVSVTQRSTTLRRPAPATHSEMLRAVGFAEVECPLRLWEAGVIWASKTR